MSATTIFDHGYLAENLDYFKSEMNLKLLGDKLLQASTVFSPGTLQDLSVATKERLVLDSGLYSQRLTKFISYLSQPDLGGVMMNPLNT